MNSTQLNEISQDLYDLLLNLQKKLFNPDELKKKFSLPSSHIKVIVYLKHNGNCPISKIAKDLLISKPNMTPIIDKLISENMVTRYTDPKDRRVIRVELTEEGVLFIKDQEKLIKALLAEKISDLSSEDLQYLSNHIIKIKNIILKIN
ncbi:MarR family winged helix-turn-helix transcriptional regulator [Clostridium botulinum]|uniref:MarR family transcriptional regulator n=1 Tax=Clostridium botulinum TaxID=1491 RepID=A0A846J607_CLOBO|nr:MarR family transcriptional regulator [Clostridium botulinum]ACA53638.1 transcriptional regulator, MarR family [Clostridium botulinum A3 str. Loch Maree]NFH65790.1 MarR family transcriptional regulator [Clostridium botulinum]NFJ08660.1 MarR family transcriptional regulator [Clostridium botulinum]NFK15056.1 MarR family transcriptional regulator [Clostridium botulinum]NFM93017.1 MarR family transcriptional regulator [Clostridium botulinum]